MGCFSSAYMLSGFTLFFKHASGSFRQPGAGICLLRTIIKTNAPPGLSELSDTSIPAGFRLQARTWPSCIQRPRQNGIAIRQTTTSLPSLGPPGHFPSSQPHEPGLACFHASNLHATTPRVSSVYAIQRFDQRHCHLALVAICEGTHQLPGSTNGRLRILAGRISQGRRWAETGKMRGLIRVPAVAATTRYTVVHAAPSRYQSQHSISPRAQPYLQSLGQTIIPSQSISKLYSPRYT